MKKVPDIRVKGFCEDWKRCKFSELYKKVSEKNDMTYGKDKIISVANMYFKPDSYITDQEYLRTYNVFHLGDIAFEGNKSKNFAHGRFVENTIGNGIVSHVFDVFRPIMEYDLLFWKYAINNEQIMGEVLVRSTKASTMMTNLVAKDFGQESILIPSVEEQNKIGNFLKQIDTLITLHQLKLNKLKLFKQSMLDKMFPKNGEKVPEIRLEGFSGDWEKRKLSDIVEVCSGRDYKHLSEGTIPVYGTGGYMLSVNEALSYDQDAIGIGRKGTIDKPYVLKAPFWTVDTLFYAIPKHSECLDFVHDIFQNIEWKKKDESTGVPSLSKEAINDTDIIVPKIDEQVAIGSFFSTIDTLISFHQRKLEKLKQFKKSMLNKMFI